MDEGLLPEERKKQKRAIRKQENAIALQKQRQELEFSEAADDVARKRQLALSPRKGRRSLISPQGLKNTLG